MITHQHGKKENHILKRNPPSNLDETHIHQCPLLVKIGHVNLLGRFGIPSIPSIPSNKPVVKLDLPRPTKIVA